MLGRENSSRQPSSAYFSTTTLCWANKTLAKNAQCLILKKFALIRTLFEASDL